jgi:hypothetical protein
MHDCQHIEAFVTPYVDAVLDPADAERVARHLGECRVCRGRVHEEQAVRALIAARRPTLTSTELPTSLRSRCTLLAAAGASTAWRARLGPLALAASVVIGVGGAFLYERSAHSTRLMAAELTADHLKCFRVLNTLLGTHHDQAHVEGEMASSFGWPMHLPANPEREGLELVGARPCLYPEGKIAHIMFRHRGNPVSLFMLPDTVRGAGLVDVLGHEAAIWSVGNRTFVLVSTEPRAEVERMTAFVQAGLR